MHSLWFKPNGGGPLNVLCLGAHCDDIEIGCGATILRLIQDAPQISVRWVVFSGNENRHKEARDSASDLLQAVADKQILLKRYPEAYFPYYPDLKREFEELKVGFDPTLIFTHYREDRHQDHRVIADLTWNTFRNHMIMEYEIPKYEGDLSNPNVFVPVSRDHADRKVNSIVQHFKSQHARTWFSPDTFLSLMRLRGINCNAGSGLAEAFYCRKVVL